MITLRELFEAWEGFFHTPEPPVTVAVFRILFGLLLVINALLIAREARYWLGPEGVLSHDNYRQEFGRFRFSLFNYLPARNSSVYIVLAMHIFAATFLTLGLFTRISSILAFVTLVSIFHRNPLIHHSGDAVLRLMSFLLIFSPAGEALSLDNLLGDRPQLHAVPAVSPWCLRLMQLQVSIVYFRAFLCKLGDPDWLKGTAIYYPTQIETFRRFPGGSIFANRRVQKLATWSVLCIEFSVGPLIWIEEFRYPILLCVVLFHLSIEYFMNIQLFSWIMIVCLLLFVEPHYFEVGIDFIRVLAGV